MKLKLLIMLSSVLVSVQAFSGLLVDPYLGAGRQVQTLSATGVTVADPDPESTSSVGARLGYSFILVSAGIDYEMQTIDESKATNISAFVGVDMPILVRAWAEYFLSSKYDLDEAGDVGFKDGYGIGIGFTGLPFVSLNLEIQNLNYEVEAGANDLEFGTTTTTFSVSFPINL
jgi:hypothetical protein